MRHASEGDLELDSYVPSLDLLGIEWPDENWHSEDLTGWAMASMFSRDRDRRMLGAVVMLRDPDAHSLLRLEAASLLEQAAAAYIGPSIEACRRGGWSWKQMADRMWRSSGPGALTRGQLPQAAQQRFKRWTRSRSAQRSAVPE